jgi:protein-L-isoaspartate(D-aspartate) O-methyltransferase
MVWIEDQRSWMMLMVPERAFDLDASREDLIKSLKREGILKSQVVEDAIMSVPRDKFLWRETPEFLAYADEPQGLGESGQTISAPHMVVIMLEELELSRGLRVLEVGGGSGYNAALMAWICSRGEKARVFVSSIERDEALAKFARENIEQVGLSQYIEVIEGDGSLGYPQELQSEIYDRIIVAAAANRVPLLLKAQLKTGGILEVPVGGNAYQKLLKIKKGRAEDGTVWFKEKPVTDCIFVPLVGGYS